MERCGACTGDACGRTDILIRVKDLSLMQWRQGAGKRRDGVAAGVCGQPEPEPEHGAPRAQRRGRWRRRR